LNDDQKAVYDAPITKNLQVIAGPGTGKTHTLIIRIARLIQEEKVNPDNILVLAYNRAVVVELKARLTKLFNELGYSKLIKRLKVFTFHGFCKYCLRDQLDHKPFSEWTAEFLRLTKNRPGHISQILGNIKYVFVDEFQDITNERLELLKYVANPKRTNICVIGDPNQSIYGYERSNLGDTMDPVFYYEKYQEIYAPNTFALTVNYRSFSEIIKQSELLLAQNSTVFDMPKMQAKVSDHDENDIVEIIDYDKNRVKWQDKLVELVHHKRQDGGKYRQIALMFRSNEEVFKAFNDVADIQFDDVRIRIQGSNQSLYKSREFFHLNNYLIENPRLILSANFFQEISKRANALLNTHQNWSEYIIHLYLCIVLEFEKEAEAESTNQELLDFIFDLSAKDDGQLGKLYQQNIPRVNPGKRETEIVLTTMHKVKGMEYDAVMIPASFSNFPHSSVSQGLEIADLIEEERRLYYVAYSRAKYKLVVIKWKREKAIEQGVSCSLMTEDERRERLGISFKDGIDKLKLYWGASNYGQESFIWILDNVKIGDPVVLAKEIIAGYSFWHVMHNGIKIGQLSAMASGRLDGCSRVHGYSISAMSVHTYEETINSPTGADFAKNWTAESKDRGYIYLVDFSGYGKESQIN
jgi:ATP-dependent DNA helicase RecQ